MGKRGPAPWLPTDEQRAKVRVLMASRVAIETIASIIGVSHMTLRKGCAEEIANGRELELAHNRIRLQKAAEGGNVAAIKYLDLCLRQSAAMDEFDDDTPKVRSTDRRVGKKEEQRDAAIRAMDGSDGEWGSDLKPGALN